jgi:type 1 fimbria pilin
MRNTFNRNKTKLAIATLAAGLGLHLASNAQAANDAGTLIINGQISNSTCVLGLGDGGSTSSGSKTLNLGNATSTVANTAGDGGTFGTAQSVVFSIQNPSNSSQPCSLGANNTFWDIGINLSSSQVSSISGGTNSVLLSGGTSGLATGVGVLIKTTAGVNPTVGTTNLDLLRGGYNGNTLLSGSTSFPGVSPANKIALTAQFVKLGSASAGAGAFTATVPLTVWYK